MQCLRHYALKEDTMKWSKWLETWDMTSLKINLKYLEMEWQPKTADQDAAWELYIELLTRVATQRLPAEHGDEDTALESIYALFELTRTIIKTHKRDCVEFTKLAVVVLNQVIRPFTAKWHKRRIEGAFKDAVLCAEFRLQLNVLQSELRKYTQMLSSMAGVEDLTDLETLEKKAQS